MITPVRLSSFLHAPLRILVQIRDQPCKHSALRQTHDYPHIAVNKGGIKTQTFMNDLAEQGSRSLVENAHGSIPTTASAWIRMRR